MNWSELISKRRKLIPALATKLDVNERYLIHNTDFIRCVMLDEPKLAERVLSKVQERLNDLK